MAEREMLLADNLYAKLLTTMMHNTGLSSSKTPTTFLSDVPLRQVAESRGYTVTWNKADGSTTIAKGDVTYTFTPESYECVTGTGAVSYTHLNDEELDALYMAAQTEMDHDKRVEMYRDIQQQVYDNANVIPLYRNDFAFARSAKVDGLQVNPFYVYQAMYWTKAN